MPTPFDNDYWAEEAQEFWSALVPSFIDAFGDGVAGGASLLPDGVRILVDHDFINQSVLDYAKQYQSAQISGIIETTRKQTQELIVDWLKSGAPLDDLAAELAPIFGRVRAEMIASTEVTRIFAEGNQAAWDSTGHVKGRKWITTRDDRVCPICQPLDGVIAAQDHYFFSEIGGGFPNPPAHVRCRCWIQPIVDIEAAAKQRKKRLGL